MMRLHLSIRFRQMVRLTLDTKSWVALPPWHTYKGGIIQHIRFMSLMFLCLKDLYLCQNTKG